MMNIVYVDSDDKVIGSGPIAEAYQKGIVVRIARIFLLNKNGELLIQKRSDNHQSLPGRWDQSAAGHVDEGETYEQTAARELAEEMGITNVKLQKAAKYYTEEKDEVKFIKRRFNMIFKGSYDGKVTIDNHEVSDYMWINRQELDDWMHRSQNDFTDGFIKAYKILKNKLD